MSEEDMFGMWYWHEELEEEQEWQGNCPNCGSNRTNYDENRGIWICLDCNYKWENVERY